jgi:hypothetical protein
VIRTASHGDVRPSSRARWIVPTVLGALLVTCLGGLTAWVGSLAMVGDVEFVGQVHAAPRELRHLAGVRNGTPLWAVDLSEVERRVERHPWVDTARARLEWPDHLVVEVGEHEPVALLMYDGLFYVDAQGRVFLRARADDLDYPVISGLDPALERRHPELPRRVLRDALALLDLLEARDLVGREQVSEIAFSDTRGFTVMLQDGARLGFGLDGHEVQAGRLDTLLREGLVDLRRPILVDLAPPSVAIVRPVALPPPAAPVEKPPALVLYNPTL